MALFYFFDALSTIIALLAGFFAFRVVRNARDFRAVRFLMMLGIAGYAFGELLSFIFELRGFDIFPSIADVFFVAGSLSFISGLFYFWLVSTRPEEKFTLKDILTFSFVILLTVSVLGYVFVAYALPLGLGSGLQAILNVFYPVSTAFIFAQAFLLRNFFEESPLKLFFRYFSDGVFFFYFGDLTFTYSMWSNTHGVIDIVYSLFYLAGYALILFAFYLDYKKEN